MSTRPSFFDTFAARRKRRSLGASSSVSERETPDLSVVVPCFNEEEVLAETHKRLTRVLTGLGRSYEIVLIDDGSSDKTARLIADLVRADPTVKGIMLARNFGHQLAVSAGLEAARGNAVVIIDADLQDPPEVMAAMIAKWEEGAEVVYGQRVLRKGESGFKRWTASMFYRLLNGVSEIQIPLDVGDFRLLDRKVVHVMRAMPERDRYLRGMAAWVGFRQVALPYEREPRFAGVSKYPLRKMIWFALDGLMSFTLAPLRMVILVGFATVALAVLGILYAIALRIFTQEWVSGWTLLFIALMFTSGVQLMVMGAIGEYVGRIYMSVKQRPLYVVREVLSSESVPV